MSISQLRLYCVGILIIFRLIDPALEVTYDGYTLKCIGSACNGIGREGIRAVVFDVDFRPKDTLQQSGPDSGSGIEPGTKPGMEPGTEGMEPGTETGMEPGTEAQLLGGQEIYTLRGSYYRVKCRQGKYFFIGKSIALSLRFRPKIKQFLSNCPASDWTFSFKTADFR